MVYFVTFGISLRFFYWMDGRYLTLYLFFFNCAKIVYQSGELHKTRKIKNNPLYNCKTYENCNYPLDFTQKSLDLRDAMCRRNKRSQDIQILVDLPTRSIKNVI